MRTDINLHHLVEEINNGYYIYWTLLERKVGLIGADTSWIQYVNTKLKESLLTELRLFNEDQEIHIIKSKEGYKMVKKQDLSYCIDEKQLLDAQLQQQMQKIEGKGSYQAIVRRNIDFHASGLAYDKYTRIVNIEKI